MGLDNGIILRTKHMINPKDIPPYIKIELSDWEEDNDYNTSYWDYDICYWRKCWNVQKAILELGVEEDNNGYYELTIYNICCIIDFLIEYLKFMEQWQWDYEDGNTIWEAEDMVAYIAQDIVNLNWLKEYLFTNRGSVAIFYDSY